MWETVRKRVGVATKERSRVNKLLRWEISLEVRRWADDDRFDACVGQILLREPCGAVDRMSMQ